jgi:uncharacterized membrane protein YhaH (DUF805 family)
MITDPRQILLRPGGRLPRAEFMVGAVAFVALSYAGIAIMQWLDPATGAGFWFGLFVFVFALPYMLYSVAGQRLHDMGRSVWPLTWLLVLMVIAMFAVAYANGGEEYIDTLSKFDRKEAIDPAIKAQADQIYQDQLAAGGANMKLKLILGGMLGAFTLWLALSPGQKGENKYGSAAY